MNAQLLARLLGIVFFLAGVAGVVPWSSSPAPFDANVITLDQYYRFIFGMLPVNLVHDGLHALLGVWGLLAGSNFRASVGYLRFVAVFYLFIVILGIIPITNTLFGAVPIYGWDVLLHLVAVLIAAYGGFGAGSIQQTEPE
jgi:hypothetical protein